MGLLRSFRYLILAVLVITVLRWILVGFRSVLGNLFQSRPQGAKTQGPTLVSTELKRDPVCGVFVPASAPVRAVVGTETYFFCSNACREKFAK